MYTYITSVGLQEFISCFYVDAFPQVCRMWLCRTSGNESLAREVSLWDVRQKQQKLLGSSAMNFASPRGPNWARFSSSDMFQSKSVNAVM